MSTASRAGMVDRSHCGDGSIVLIPVMVGMHLPEIGFNNSEHQSFACCICERIRCFCRFPRN